MTIKELHDSIKRHTGPVAVWCPGPFCRIAVSAVKTKLIDELRILANIWEEGWHYETGWVLSKVNTTLIIDICTHEQRSQYMRSTSS